MKRNRVEDAIKTGHFIGRGLGATFMWFLEGAAAGAGLVIGLELLLWLTGHSLTIIFGAP